MGGGVKTRSKKKKLEDMWRDAISEEAEAMGDNTAASLAGLADDDINVAWDLAKKRAEENKSTLAFYQKHPEYLRLYYDADLATPPSRSSGSSSSSSSSSTEDGKIMSSINDFKDKWGWRWQ